MPSFLISALEVLIGIGLLFGGGELFVQGSIALALILGIPQLVIGLTVVSLGTSAPELFVSVSSILKGSDALAISNVVGSNIFNVMVVLGSSALVLPLKVESRLVRRDIPVLLAVSASVWGMASAGRITWQAGLALLIALIINTIWEIRTAREEPEGMKNAEPEINEKFAERGIFPAICLLIVGIFLLALGSNLLVIGASSVAIELGVKEAVIGLTIVSAGTSMPELVTSLVAALKGRTDLAIGNVVGSSLLNQLLVLGSCAIVSGSKGLFVEEMLIQRDMPVMVLTTLACMPIFWTKGQISRLEGGLLVGLYFCYLTDQVLPHVSNLQNEFRLLMFCLVLPLSTVLIIYKTLDYWQLVRRSRTHI
ncbi:calcium/sodium antiporter [Prochlorococcus sp. MIT 1300]|uniref:calcium/sodium antiporter n=1 Tax=Prochlorococcus sp. MIT 1300 TaxID=3096218 RepID=UPI002A764781|nr:calcium/sodium antiporter [Prochlorococcus sp. MIT 1300]